MVPCLEMPGWVPLIDKQLRQFVAEMKKDVPTNAVGPRRKSFKE